MRSLADAYSAGAEAWAEGPERIYGTLADLLVASSPIDLRGRRVLDLGSGTGAASRPAVAAGADVVAVDTALGMLQLDRASSAWRRRRRTRASAATGVVRRRRRRVLAEPSRRTRRRPFERSLGVIRDEGVLLASVYANDDDHPVKQAAEQATAEWGWQPPAWYPRVKRSMAAWGTVDDATEAIEQGGHAGRVRRASRDRVPRLGPDALVGWRLGMAQFAGFVETLDDQQRRAVGARCRELLGDNPDPLVRRVIFIIARAH